MTQKKKYPMACKIPGCLAISPHCKFHGYCPPHYRRQLHSIYYPRHSRRDRAIQLAQWLTRNKKPRANPPPMTPAERLIYEEEVNRLVTLYPPRSQYYYAQLCGRAAMWARGGGRAAYQKRTGIEARKAGWRRKWLREGTYDPVVLERELARIKAEKALDITPLKKSRVTRRKED